MALSSLFLVFLDLALDFLRNFQNFIPFAFFDILFFFALTFLVDFVFFSFCPVLSSTTQVSQVFENVFFVFA